MIQRKSWMQVDFIFLGKSYFYTFETYALTVLEIIWENAQVDFPKIFKETAWLKKCTCQEKFRV